VKDTETMTSEVTALVELLLNTVKYCPKLPVFGVG
jgi:hypothetical protein